MFEEMWPFEHPINHSPFNTLCELQLVERAAWGRICLRDVAVRCRESRTDSSRRWVRKWVHKRARWRSGRLATR